MLRSCVQDEDEIQEITFRRASRASPARVFGSQQWMSTEVDGDFGEEARHGRSRNYER